MKRAISLMTATSLDKTISLSFTKALLIHKTCSCLCNLKPVKLFFNEIVKEIFSNSLAYSLGSCISFCSDGNLKL